MKLGRAAKLCKGKKKAKFKACVKKKMRIGRKKKSRGRRR